jgi:hypothetical protein
LTQGYLRTMFVLLFGNKATMEYKRNQVEEAVFRTFGAREERRNELRFRIKRLLVTDRRLGRNVCYLLLLRSR